MSAGIYKCNGVVAYTMNLEKKLKKRKGATILETYEGELTGDDLENELKDMMFKYETSIIKKEDSDNIKKYRFKNKRTGEQITSIYNHLDNIPNINKDEWTL